MGNERKRSMMPVSTSSESSLLAALTADEKQVLAGLFRELVLALETEHVPHDRRPIVTARSLPSPPE